MKQIIIILCILIAGCTKPSSHQIKKAEKFIADIEAYHQKMGQYPSNQQAWKIMESHGLQADESCQPCYVKTNEDYVVYFGTSLGESYTYSPDTQTWQ